MIRPASRGCESATTFVLYKGCNGTMSRRLDLCLCLQCSNKWTRLHLNKHLYLYSVSIYPAAADYSKVSPSAHLTMLQPARTVSLAPCSSRLGFTSTRSSATSEPVSATHSAMKSPSRRVNPPRTGVPVLGAHMGSSASTSNDRWIGVSLPIQPSAMSMTLPMPCLSMSCMENALIPCSRRIFFSPLSTSRRPMYTIFLGLSRWCSFNHPNVSSRSSFASPVKNATGMPWMFPLSDVSGVLMSACASTQMTAISLSSRSRIALAVPETVPIAMEWSPPSVRTNLPSLAWLYTCSLTSLVTALTNLGCFMLRYTGSSAGTNWE